MVKPIQTRRSPSRFPRKHWVIFAASLVAVILSTVAVILASNYYLGGPKDDSPPKQIEVVQAPANLNSAPIKSDPPKPNSSKVSDSPKPIPVKKPVVEVPRPPEPIAKIAPADASKEHAVVFLEPAPVNTKFKIGVSYRHFPPRDSSTSAAPDST